MSDQDLDVIGTLMPVQGGGQEKIHWNIVVNRDGIWAGRDAPGGRRIEQQLAGQNWWQPFLPLGNSCEKVLKKWPPKQ